VENLREHYAQTLRHWIARLERNEDRAVALVGRPTYRVWKLYFAASARWFDTARINVCQTLLSRPDPAGDSHLPRSRADLYSHPAQHAETVAEHASREDAWDGFSSRPEHASAASSL
jgi:cyclopropane-fatty-acyl-phospholipid synthase